MTPQEHQILTHIKRRGSITSTLAFEYFGITRLAARIADLRGRGHRIKTTMVRGRDCNYAVYTEEQGK